MHDDKIKTNTTWGCSKADIVSDIIRNEKRRLNARRKPSIIIFSPTEYKMWLKLKDELKLKNA